MVLIYPVLAQVLLTLVLLAALGIARTSAARRGEVRLADIALDEHGWPKRVRQIGNCLRNQFETPLLFYVLVPAAIFVQAAEAPMAILAWIFVASRVAFVWFHTGSNEVLTHFRAFGGGSGARVAMWTMIAVRLGFVGAGG